MYIHTYNILCIKLNNVASKEERSKIGISATRPTSKVAFGSLVSAHVMRYLAGQVANSRMEISKTRRASKVALRSSVCACDATLWQLKEWREPWRQINRDEQLKWPCARLCVHIMRKNDVKMWYENFLWKHPCENMMCKHIPFAEGCYSDGENMFVKILIWKHDVKTAKGKTC